MENRPSHRRRGGRSRTRVAARPPARPARAAAPDEPARAVRLAVAGELALGVAHTLANVLGALRMRLGTLAVDRPAEEANVRELSRLADEAAALVTNLQTLGRPGPRASAVNVARVVRDAIELARARFRLERRESAAIEIAWAPPPLPPALAQADELRLVIVELLLNARDALPDGGHVVVSADATDELVRIRVADDGTGISEAALPHVFELFFTTKGERGTGIGLAAARDLLRRGGGGIEAHNREEGGACFEIVLPRAAAGPPVPPVG